MNGYHCPEPTVVNDSELDILEIRNGEEGVTSEEFARGVVVYSDKDSDAHEAKEPAFTVAVRFLDAEKTLKPFVDAILRQRGLDRMHRRTRRPRPILFKNGLVL